MSSFFANIGQSIYDTMIAGDSYLLILEGLGITILIDYQYGNYADCYQRYVDSLQESEFFY